MGTTLLPLQGAIIYDMIYLKQPVDVNDCAREAAGNPFKQVPRTDRERGLL